jgi:hypothetical protein
MGGYLIYRRFPNERVFVDGRADYYGTDFTEKWAYTIRARYYWKQELSTYSIDTVLLKTEDPLASLLKQSPDWKPVFDDGRAIVFRKVR